MTVLVFIDPAHPGGRVADPDAPQLSVLDPGVTRGDGVFESALYTGGKVRKLEMHLSRMAVSAQVTDLIIPSAGAWRAAIATAISQYDAAASPGAAPAESVVKLIATRGAESADGVHDYGSAWVTVSPAPELGRRQRETGIDVLLLDRGYDSTVAERAPWLLMGAKTLSYAVNMAAIRHAKRNGADDVIFTSSDGRVLEGPTSTVLLATRERDAAGREVKRLVTPTLETGILPGTTQGAIFAAAKAEGWELGYGPVEPKHLREAAGVWLVSSVRLLTPVNSLDGEAIRTDAKLTAELAAMVDSIN